MENSINRFGSADFASEDDIVVGGLFRETPDSLFVGFCGSRRLWYSGLGGVLLTAGARSGKLKDWLGYTACGIGCTGQNLLYLDPKGEAACIGRGLTLRGRAGIYINPYELHGFPCARFNPFSNLHIGSRTLVADVKLFCLNILAPSGSKTASFFEDRAREFLEGIMLAIVRRDGVMTAPALYQAISLIPAGSEAWLDFAFEMQEAGYTISARIEEEIANARKDSSGGYQGILGELFKSVACLSDDRLMAAVSPPFDFSFAELLQRDLLYDVYFMLPAEYLGSCALIVKSTLVDAMLTKARAPDAPRQTWILDECAQLAGGISGGNGGFPLVAFLFSFAAGIGVRPVCVVQSGKQLDALSPDGETIITSSAALRASFAIRDLPSATKLSNMLGAQTLVWEDKRLQAQERHSRDQALHRIFEDDDPLRAMLDYSHHAEAAEMSSKQHRMLMTPAEILGMPVDEQIIFVDGVSRPIRGHRAPYFEQRWVRFYPNRYYPPSDQVRVKSLLGHAWLDLIDEPVPPQFAHLPQHADGRWKRISPRKWWQL